METAAIEGVCRAVIVTALPIEFSAVCEHLEDRKEDKHPQGTVYECGRFRPATGREWEVIVVEIGAGNTGAAAEVERAITYCHPNVVLFAGVAGGMKDVAIGAVVAGSKVYGYESGKESAGFKPRPSVHESNYRLTQRAKAEARNGIWRQRIVGGIPDSPPRALVGPIAAGEKVVADSQSSTSQLLANAYGDALAVEMEGSCSHLCLGLAVLLQEDVPQIQAKPNFFRQQNGNRLLGLDLLDFRRAVYWVQLIPLPRLAAVVVPVAERASVWPASARFGRPRGLHCGSASPSLSAVFESCGRACHPRCV